MEYIYQTNTIDLVVSGKLANIGIPKLLPVKNNFYFQPNETKKILAGYTRSYISMSEKPCNQMVDVKIELQAPKSTIKLFFTENAIGKILTDIITVNLSGVPKKSCDIDSKISSFEELIK